MSYQVFGRAIKSEYISLSTILATAAVAYASMSGGKKEAAPSGASIRETIQKVKESVPLGASSSEEEQLFDSITKFIEEEERKATHH